MTTSTYLGVNRPFNVLSGAAVAAASSTTSTTDIELRIDVVTQDSTAHNLTKYDVLSALEQFRRYVMNSDFLVGEGGAAANIPLPIGAPTAGG